MLPMVNTRDKTVELLRFVSKTTSSDPKQSKEHLKATVQVLRENMALVRPHTWISRPVFQTNTPSPQEVRVISPQVDLLHGLPLSGPAQQGVRSIPSTPWADRLLRLTQRCQTPSMQVVRSLAWINKGYFFPVLWVCLLLELTCFVCECRRFLLYR